MIARSEFRRLETAAPPPPASDGAAVFQPPFPVLKPTPLRPTRRHFLNICAIGSAALASGGIGCATRTSGRALKLTAATVPDPDGHHAALRLKGDWLFIAISDGQHTGLGEISHSRNDAACLRRVRELFAAHATHVRLTRAGLEELARGPFALAEDLVTATALSGIDQALHDLVAQREGVPVWQLYVAKPAQDSVACYLSTNRALHRREPDDYARITDTALARGAAAVKITPFESVTPTGDQLAQAEEGFARLDAMRAAHPRVSLRIDCHERFSPENAAKLLPRFARYQPEWLEEPCPSGPWLAELRAISPMRFAAGELLFGEAPFRALLEQRVDVVMPDPKYVGGMGPLVRVCQLVEKLGGRVSPHNPSGPVATRAAVHAAAVSAAVVSMELILTSDPARQPAQDLLSAGRLRIPRTPGWGLTMTQLSAQTGARFEPIKA